MNEQPISDGTMRSSLTWSREQLLCNGFFYNSHLSIPRSINAITRRKGMGRLPTSSGIPKRRLSRIGFDSESASGAESEGYGKRRSGEAGGVRWALASPEAIGALDLMRLCCSPPSDEWDPGVRRNHGQSVPEAGAGHLLLRLPPPHVRGRRVL